MVELPMAERLVGTIDPFNQVVIEEDLWKTFPHSHRVGDHTAWGRILCQLKTIDLCFRWSRCRESSHTSPFSPWPCWWVLREVNPYPTGIWQWPSSPLCNATVAPGQILGNLVQWLYQELTSVAWCSGEVWPLGGLSCPRAGLPATSVKVAPGCYNTAISGPWRSGQNRWGQNSVW